MYYFIFNKIKLLNLIFFDSSNNVWIICMKTDNFSITNIVISLNIVYDIIRDNNSKHK